MGNIVDPRTTRAVRFGDVSKDQLAREVNRLGAENEMLREQVRATGRVLLAIVLEPEAFYYADGRRTVDRAAVERVQKGTTLSFDFQDTRVVLSAVVPPPPEERTRIVLPPRPS